MKTMTLLALLAIFFVADKTQAQEKIPPIKVTAVSLNFDNTKASDILSALAKSSGMTVTDKRTFDEDKLVSVHLDKVPFWKAVDTIANKVGAVVSPYGQLTLVDGTSRAPVDNRGLVRASVNRVETNLDLISGLRKCRLQLEFAWEPRLQPFYAEVDRWEIVFAPDKEGKVDKQSHVGTGKQKTFGVSAVELPLSCLAPDRSCPGIASLKGEVSLITPKSMWDVRFVELHKFQKPEMLERDGVKVSLMDFQGNNPGVWRVMIRLDHPGSGGLLDSSEQHVWLVNNRVYLQHKKDASRIIEASSVEDGDAQNTIQKIIYFENSDLTDPGDWEMVYRTAGPIVEVKVPFAFENVPLP